MTTALFLIPIVILALIGGITADAFAEDVRLVREWRKQHGR
jgi:hypothetical protein